MSTDETTLSDFARPAEPAETERGYDPEIMEGARYGQRKTPPDAETEKRPMCRGCDRPLADIDGMTETRARELARVVGDNDGHVPSCPDCVDIRDPGSEVATVTKAVHLKRGATE